MGKNNKAVPDAIRQMTVDQLPDPFTYTQAKELGNKIGVHVTTVRGWGLKAGKKLAGSVKENPVVAYTDPKFLRSGDKVLVQECVDGKDHNGQWGNLIAYHEPSGFYTVKIGDQTCVCTKVHKEVEVPKTTKKKRKIAKQSKPELRRFIAEVIIQTGMPVSKAQSIFGYKDTTMYQWISMYKKNPHAYPRYSEQQAKLWSSEYGIELDNGQKTETTPEIAKEEGPWVTPAEPAQTTVITTLVGQVAVFTEGDAKWKFVIGEDGSVIMPTLNQKTGERNELSFTKNKAELESLILILDHINSMIPEPKHEELSQPND